MNTWIQDTYTPWYLDTGYLYSLDIWIQDIRSPGLTGIDEEMFALELVKFTLSTFTRINTQMFKKKQGLHLKLQRHETKPQSTIQPQTPPPLFK